jgi:D-3-phosphoglycerate dehydrogenase
MEVVAHDPHLTPADGERLGIELTSLDDLLARADVVTLHVPLTPETRGLLDASRLAAMKPGSLLVNCSRGGVVDEAALLGALDDGPLAGAGLDVFASEPLGDFALASHPKVVATPHLGASTREAQERISLEAARMVLAALDGSLAVSAVNLPFAWRPGSRDDLLRLGEQLGRLAAGVLGEPVSRVVVTPGGVPPELLRPVTLAVAVGALGARRPDERVSYVNVEGVAEAAGVTVETAPRTGPRETPESLGVAVTGTSGETIDLGGALLDGSRARVVRFGSIPLEFRPVGPLLVLRSRDVPGVVGQVGALLGEAGVNIADIHLARRDGEPEAWTVLRLDDPVEPSVLAALGDLGPVTAVRPVEL